MPRTPHHDTADQVRVPAHVGHALRRARAGWGWSQRDAADRIGIRQQTLTDIERGGDFHVSTLVRLCQVYRIPPTWVFAVEHGDSNGLVIGHDTGSRMVARWNPDEGPNNRRGLLIVGDPSSGKTTLAGRVARAGVAQLRNVHVVAPMPTNQESSWWRGISPSPRSTTGINILSVGSTPGTSGYEEAYTETAIRLSSRAVTGDLVILESHDLEIADRLLLPRLAAVGVSWVITAPAEQHQSGLRWCSAVVVCRQSPDSVRQVLVDTGINAQVAKGWADVPLGGRPGSGSWPALSVDRERRLAVVDTHL